MKKAKKRQAKVLKYLVEEYIQNMQPVSSGLLSNKYLTQSSPAIVRLDLVKLEKKGYLFQPHTSSGRIPTVLGYRSYLKLIAPDLIFEDQKQTKALRNLLLENYRNPSQSLQFIMRLLAKQTQQLSFVAEPEILYGYLKRLSVFKISSTKLLFVVSLSSGMDKTVIIKCDHEITEQQLNVLVKYANERFSGLRIFDIQNKYLVQNKQEESREILRIFLIELRNALSQLSNFYIHFDGNIAFLEQPEFDSKSSILTFFSLLRRQDILTKLMQNCPIGKDYHVLMGEDLVRPEWAGFSLIFARYELFGIPGFLGIVAPNRVDYKKHICLVRNYSQVITTTTSSSSIMRF